MLPVEVWQEVLGFCPFDVYTWLIGLRRAAVRWRPSVEWLARPASREFYHLLKLSLLEMTFRDLLPSASLGGLWLASRGEEAKCIRKLRLSGVSPFRLSFVQLFAHFFLFCLQGWWWACQESSWNAPTR